MRNLAIELMLVLSGLIYLEGNAQAIVQVDPPTSNIEITNGFTVDIQIGTVNNLYGFATDVIYDPAIIQPVLVTEGDILSENGTVQTFFQFDIDNDEGKIIIGIVRMDDNLPGVNVSNPDAVVSITFQTVGLGVSSIDLQNTGLIAPDGVTTYSATVTDGSVTVFELNQSVDVSINPLSYQTQQNETFELDVVLGPVSELMAFAVEVVYDPSVLQLLQVTQGDFLNENGNVSTSFMKDIDNFNGKCVIGISRLTDPTSGVSSGQNNSVLTLKYKSNNPGTTAIELQNVGLINPNGVTYYTHIISNGQVVFPIDPNSSILTFSPDEFDIYPEQSFSSEINVSNVQDLFALSVDVVFDPNLIEVTEVTEGDFLNTGGTSQTTFLKNIDNVNGILVVGISRSNVGGGVSSNFPIALFEVEFKTKNNGIAQLQMSNIGLIAPDGITSYPSFAHNLDITIKDAEGTINGVVTDSETGLPLQGAHVSATGGFACQSTDYQGNYTIKAPYGMGYHLFTSAEGYGSSEITGVNLSTTNPTVTMDVGLTEIEINPIIVDMDPNPNPAISEIGEGGTVHRYYYIKDLVANEALPLIDVVVLDENNKQYNFRANTKGILDIEIPSDDINSGNVGDIYDYSIITLDGEPLVPTVDFTCEVVDREYSKYWDSNEFGKLGISFVSVDFARGSSVILTESDASIVGAETLYVTRQGRAGVGVDFSVGAAVSVTCGEIVTGGGASAGGGISRSGITEDYYQFPHQNYSNNEALVQYLLFADGNYHILDNTLIRLLSKIEEIFGQQSTLEAAYLGDKKGIDVMIGVSAYANFGTPVLGGLIDVGADVSLGAEGHVLFNTIHNDQLNENEFNFGVSGSYNASAYGGLTFNLPKYEDSEPVYNWPQEYEDKLNLFDEGGTRGFEFSIVKDAITNDFAKYKIKFLNRNDVSGWEEVMRYEIEGSEVYGATQSFREQFLQVNILNDISSSIGNIRISNDLFSQLTFALFNTLYDLQTNDNGDATITYKKTIKGMTNISGFPINIKGLLGHSLLSVEVGGGTSFEEGKMMLSEKGKWVWGHHLALENYGNSIPEINQEYQEVIQDIVDEIPLWIRIGLGVINAVVSGKDNETMFYIMDSLGVDTAAYIAFPTGSFPTNIDSIYCVSWGWYGSETKQLLSDLNPKLKNIYQTNRQRAEESFGMKYGVGGMFQLEPLDTLLVDTAYMTIIYTDSMVVDIDETSLGMYKEDKANHSWIHVGGVVDTLNNLVTAPITDLSLYTLAPTMPIGTFSLAPSVDSIYADSISTAIVTSGIIYYNNSDTVDNGELFTINTESGIILTADIDNEIEGIQVEALNGEISFMLKSSYIAGVPKLSAFSVYGSAKANTTIVFYDTIAPSQPTGFMGIAKNEKVTLTWQQNQEDDISGYVIYYDTDTYEPPFTGVSTVYGFPSPIIIGKDTSFTVTGLSNDTTYYFSVTAYDISGNESMYSDSLSVIPTNMFSQQIILDEGWNIASFNVIPNSLQMDSIFQPLIDSNELIKVIGEGGGFIQEIDGIGWVNTISNMINTEGYYVKVTENTTLSLLGTKVSLPINIPIQAGWNIMGYPLANGQDAFQALQPIINNGTLYKIMDEQGGFIQYIDGIGWLNTIGDFEPGEGYYLKVNSSTNLTLSESSSKSTLKIIENEPLSYFNPIQGDAIYNPMNFVLKLQNENNSIITIGDEIAIFDGAFCVGATVISENNQGYVSIVTSMNDNGLEAIDGFTVDDEFCFKFWDIETDELYANVTPASQNNTTVFQPLETYIGSLSTNALGIKESNNNKNGMLNIVIAPNPVISKLKVYYHSPNSGKSVIQIFNSSGNRIISNSYDNHKTGWNSAIINVNNLNAGIYIGEIIFTTNDDVIVERFKFVKL